jgi:hypothetical protein
MLCGLLKSLHVEGSRAPRPWLRLKVIDAAADTTPEALSEIIRRELAADDAEIEVGWSPRGRRVVRTAVEPVESLPRSDLPRGGVPGPADVAQKRPSGGIAALGPGRGQDGRRLDQELGPAPGAHPQVAQRRPRGASPAEVSPGPQPLGLQPSEHGVRVAAAEVLVIGHEEFLDHAKRRKGSGSRRPEKVNSMGNVVG